MNNRTGSGAGCGLSVILVALGFIIGPFFIAGVLPPGSQVVIMGLGVLLLLVGSIVTIITRLYRKSSANEAFVRTGMGGTQCVVDGGKLVIPVVHNVIDVSLETMRLDVRRLEKDALITGDNLRTDVEAEFYIKVQKNPDDIINAATSLGERSVNAETVKELVEQKLVSALRTVAATKTLNELHTKRSDFADAVQAIVEQDLKHNGLTLESTTISRLDQTPPNALREQDNVFDAQGLKTIAAVVQAQRVERNRIERGADQQVKQQEVETQKFIYAQERERAQVEAEQVAQIKQARAEAQQKADSFTAQQEAQAGIAAIEKEKAIQVNDVEKQQAIEVANQQRERAQQIAEIEKLRAVEISGREKEIAVALKEKERAEADAQRFAAEAEKEEKRQAVQTVEVTATAEREKSRTIIDEQAGIEKDRLRRQMEADVSAYAVVKDAEGERESAARRAEAQRVLAEAQRDARVLEAGGQKAVQMVPVEVEREKVEIESARVDVKEKDLEIQSRHAEIAKDLQIALAQIEAQKQSEIAKAQAMGGALSSANMQIWGDPATFAKMSQSFLQGQSYNQMADGFLNGGSDKVKSAVGSLGEWGAALIKEVTGKDVAPSEVQQVMEEKRAAAVREDAPTSKPQTNGSAGSPPGSTPDTRKPQA
jgi:uncharacterized membrane protein YqiK